MSVNKMEISADIAIITCMDVNESHKTGAFKFVDSEHLTAKLNIHCEPKKTWQYICDHNSGKTYSIFIIFALL